MHNIIFIQLALELGFDARILSAFNCAMMIVLATPIIFWGLMLVHDIEVIRRAWLALAREHHPDRLQADGLPLECIRTATERLASINAAYEQIKNAQSPDGQDGQKS